MTTLRVVKNVLSGSGDYVFSAFVTTGSGGLVGGDSVELVFDNDIILGDVMVQGVTASGLDFNIRLYLEYPTGNVLDVTQAGTEKITSTAPFQINNNASDRNLWFRVPKWTVLRLTVDAVFGDGTFQLAVVGRG